MEVQGRLDSPASFFRPRLALRSPVTQIFPSLPQAALAPQAPWADTSPTKILRTGRAEELQQDQRDALVLAAEIPVLLDFGPLLQQRPGSLVGDAEVLAGDEVADAASFSVLRQGSPNRNSKPAADPARTLAVNQLEHGGPLESRGGQHALKVHPHLLYRGTILFEVYGLDLRRHPCIVTSTCGLRQPYCGSEFSRLRQLRKQKRIITRIDEGSRTFHTISQKELDALALAAIASGDAGTAPARAGAARNSPKMCSASDRPRLTEASTPAHMPMTARPVAGPLNIRLRSASGMDRVPRM
jgi:hypothetical protein